MHVIAYMCVHERENRVVRPVVSKSPGLDTQEMQMAWHSHETWL